MKVRLRFKKTGALVYIGHLDVMRYFQKLFRRADINVAYSEGFSPHQLLSFTPPLPLGMESDGEYADVTLKESINTKEALSRIKNASVEEIEVLSFKELPEESENAMAAVKAAGYTVTFDDDQTGQIIKDAIGSFLSKDTVNIVKKTKKNEKEINIRPLVYDLKWKYSGLYMLVSSGSVDNIKPEHVISALSGITGNVPDNKAVTIRRTDQYTRIGDDLVSLDDIGADII
ncbi:MAG: TIGR03936 family radical SAM-associated protein [Lachnospiraceae bacterium]|nr:TIGR03936 family radical SAM-associated protein [Lachnospiraceae bacterium]